MSRFLEWKKRAMLASIGGWWIPTGLTNENVIAAYRFRGVETEALALTDLTQHAYGLRYRGSNIGWSSRTGMTSAVRAGKGSVSGWAGGSLYDTKTGNGKWLHRENIRAIVFKYANHYPFSWDGGDWVRADGVHANYTSPGITAYGLSHLANIEMGGRHHLMNTTGWGTAWWANGRIRKAVNGCWLWLYNVHDRAATVGFNVETGNSGNKLFMNANPVGPVTSIEDYSVGYGMSKDNNYSWWAEQNDYISGYDGWSYNEDGGANYHARAATDPVPLCTFNSNGNNGSASWELIAMSFYNVELTQAQYAEILQKMAEI